MARKKVWQLGDVQWSGTSFSNAPVKATKPIVIVTRPFLSAPIDVDN